jgi:hypothetical protein
MIMKRWWFFKGLAMLACVAFGLLLFGFIVKTLWNGLIPDIFHGPQITFVQAIGLFLLSKVLFFTFRPWGGGWRNHRAGGHWKNRWQEKMAKMTPEEKEKFKAEWQRRCGWGFNRQSAQDKQSAQEGNAVSSNP